MFSSLKLSNLRSRSKNASTGGSTSHQDLVSAAVVTSKPPKTPVPSSKRASKCGVDKGLCPSISGLRQSSVTQKCDVTPGGDKMIAVHQVRSSKLQYEDIANLLNNVEDRAKLQTEYPIPTYPSESSLCVYPKVTTITLEREGGSLGFTLRGGSHPDPVVSCPLVITHVRPGGPAERNGTIRPGDRLIAVEGKPLHGASLHDAQEALDRPEEARCSLTVEYDTSVFQCVRSAKGPLLVEVQLPHGRDLGLTLAAVMATSESVFIEEIQPASIADRCGALHVGDELLAVNQTRLTDLTIHEAEMLLQSTEGALLLEILPHTSNSRLFGNNSRTRGLLGHKSSPSPSPSSFSTLNSRHGRKHNSRYSRATGSDSGAYQDSVCGYGSSALGVCHTENVNLILQADHHGYGLTVQSSSGVILVAGIEPGSPSDRCGCLQLGDRLVTVDHVSVGGLSTEQVSQYFVSPGEGSRISLQVEFDVAESVLPTSGIFSVKLAKRANNLGITVTGSRNCLPGEPLVISAIRPGSAAHRTGSLRQGDKLLSVDGLKILDHPHKIQTGDTDIVTLRVERDRQQLWSTEYSDCVHSYPVVYTVQLDRCGGPLGITIAGSEDHYDPIIISGLTPGGLAEQTAALHIGDGLLAINGQSLNGRPLSEAISLLQNSGDSITLKISRNATKSPGAESTSSPSHFAPGLPSIDSAVDSWDSNGSPENNTMDVYKTESATVKRKHNALGPGFETLSSHPEGSNWDDISRRSHSFDSTQSEDEVLLEQCDKCVGVDLHSSFLHHRHHASIEDSSGPQSRDKDGFAQSDASLPRYGSLSRQPHQNDSSLLHSSGSYALLVSTGNSTSQQQLELYQVTLFKDPVYEDFGFSVSDGLYERGVYINRVRNGGPADKSTLLKPYDRILQVNETQTQDFDCCLTVPLIASAGDKLELIVARSVVKDCSTVWDEGSAELDYSNSGVIIKTL